MNKKSSRIRHSAKNQKPTALTQKEDLQKSNDEHIDADFPGFPHAPSSEEVIMTQTEGEDTHPMGKKNSSDKNPKKKPGSVPTIHNGSGGAFEQTEAVGNQENHISGAREDLETDENY